MEQKIVGWAALVILCLAASVLSHRTGGKKTEIAAGITAAIVLIFMAIKDLT